MVWIQYPIGGGTVCSTSQKVNDKTIAAAGKAQQEVPDDTNLADLHIDAQGTLYYPQYTDAEKFAAAWPNEKILAFLQDDIKRPALLQAAAAVMLTGKERDEVDASIAADLGGVLPADA